VVQSEMLDERETELTSRVKGTIKAGGRGTKG